MGPSVARKEKGTGFYHQLLMEISLAKYSLVASQAREKSCRVATRATISAILSQKLAILAAFFLRFFHLSRRQFEGGCTCDFHLALATRQNLKKSHHLCEQKIARVAAALGSDAQSKITVKSF